MQSPVKILGRLGSVFVLRTKFNSVTPDGGLVAVPMGKQFGFLLVVVKLRLVVLRPRWGSGAQRHAQELICSPGLHVLFVKQVEQQVLVPLNQPLRIDLSVLQLLVPVPLDPLEQSRQCLLLPLPQQRFLLLDSFLHLKPHLVIILLLLQLLALHLQQFSLFISFHEC